MSSIPATRTVTVRERVQPQVRSRSKAKSRTTAIVLGRVATFFVLSAVTYLTSSMGGQVMVEKARREGILAQRRASEAKRSEVRLRTRINELTGFTNLDRWATAHGFIASDRPALPSGDVTRVAQLR